MSFINIERKKEWLVTCNRCGEKELKWIKSVDTRSGWELLDTKINQIHACGEKGRNTYNSNLGSFYNDLVIWESDSEEVKKKKMEYQDFIRNKGSKYK